MFLCRQAAGSPVMLGIMQSSRIRSGRTLLPLIQASASLPSSSLCICSSSTNTSHQQPASATPLSLDGPSSTNQRTSCLQAQGNRIKDRLKLGAEHNLLEPDDCHSHSLEAAPVAAACKADPCSGHFVEWPAHSKNAMQSRTCVHADPSSVHHIVHRLQGRSPTGVFAELYSREGDQSSSSPPCSLQTPGPPQ